MRLSGLSAILVCLLLGGCGQPPAYSPELLYEWNEVKAAGGPTFAGSPAWQAHMTVVEELLTEAGVVDAQTYPAPYRRWWAAEDPRPSERSLVISGEALPVASYWAYSGATPAQGVTAPLIVYDKNRPKEALQGHIVVFEVPPVPVSLGRMFSIGHHYATGDFDPAPNQFANDQWYQGNFVTRFGRFDNILRDSGAAGAIVVFSMSAPRVSGLYTFPLLNEGILGVPGIYVDQTTGARIKAAATRGESATLTLLAAEEEVTPYFYTAVLPGRDYGTANDRQILLITHSDGPNLSQENGTLAIAAIIRAYANRPQASRSHSLRVLLDPQHYSPGRHTINWYDAHPELMAPVTAVLGVEHIGQLEFGEENEAYGLTGRPEPWQIFTRDVDERIKAAIAAIEQNNLPNTELRIPERKGQGGWTGLGEVTLQRDLQGYSTLSSMSGYWSTEPGIESFDANLATRQVDTLVMLTDELMRD